MLVGFQGRKGAYIDSIQAICKQARADATLGAQTQTATAGGSGGDHVFSIVCRGHNAIAKLAVYWTLPPLEIVHSLISACHEGVYSTDGGGILRAGKEKSSDVVDTLAAGSHNATLTCPDKKFVVGIRGRAGTYIDSIGLLCDHPHVGAPPPSPPTKGSAPSRTVPVPQTPSVLPPGPPKQLPPPKP